MNLRGLSDRWRGFWFEEIPPHSYALIRILVGAVGVCTIIGAWNPDFWRVDGLLSRGGAWGIGPWLTSHGLGDAFGFGVRGALLAGFAVLAIGWRTDLIAPLMFFGSAAMLWWNQLPWSSAQELLHHIPFCLLFVDSGAVWSIDAWRRARRRSGPEPARLQPIWPLRLLRYQVALLYFSAGLWKMGSPDWRSGIALYYVLNNTLYQRFPFEVPAALFTATVALTYLTLFWELSFPALILWRPARVIALTVGVFLHLGMWITLEVGAFTPTILSAYLAFLDPFRTEARVRRLAGILVGHSASH